MEQAQKHVGADLPGVLENAAHERPLEVAWMRRHHDSPALVLVNEVAVAAIGAEETPAGTTSDQSGTISPWPVSRGDGQYVALRPGASVSLGYGCPVAEIPSEHMFDERSLVSARETAAVLALMARRPLPWNRLAGAIEEEGSALELLLRMDQRAMERLFEVDERTVTLDELEERVHSWEQEDIGLVTVLDKAYPVNLRMVHDRPPALFLRGHLSASDERSVAVVGTRRATDGGLSEAAAIAEQLVRSSYVVVSGLAAGIDTAAHEAALESGGRTVAVIGTGLRHTFPKTNASLQTQLGRQAAVLSQFWPGQEPRRWTFPQRNAVMSGFARATVVVEASGTSGAKMQARLAREHGRPVFLLSSLLIHAWARDYRDRPGVYVVDEGADVVDRLERLYAHQLTLVG